MQKHNLQLKSSTKYESDSGSDDSVGFVIESLKKEVTKISKSFTIHDKLLKKCVQDLDGNLEVSSKIQETVNEYLQVSRSSELHLQKIMSHSANDKYYDSEYMKTENSSPRNQLAPSLFDEIGDIECVAPQKPYENTVFISETNLARINNIKVVLEKLNQDIKKFQTRKKNEKKPQRTVGQLGDKGMIMVFNF